MKTARLNAGMFESFNLVWTPVLTSSELRSNQPVGLTVAGVPIVLFRNEQGVPAALRDVCPHRGAKLSLGQVDEGRLHCPFHGWQFDGQGKNLCVPWNPDTRRERLCATSFPTREIAGQIWLFTGPDAGSEPEVSDVFLREDVRVCGFSMDLDTHWTRAMENMLDWPHLPYVHRRTIGKEMVAKAARGRMDIRLHEKPWGFRSQISIDGEEQPSSLDFRFPNIMNLFIPIPKKTLVMQVACLPMTATRTRLVMMTARSFAKLPLLDRFFNRENRKIALEDRVVVESCYPAEVPRANEEAWVRTDTPTLYFRRRYYAELRSSRPDVADENYGPASTSRSPAWPAKTG